jgi:hypothetical protein
VSPLLPAQIPISLPIDAEARGKLRAWKRDFVKRHSSITAACTTPMMIKAMRGFARRGSVVGRRRAFDKLRRGFAPFATFDGVRLERDPLAVWHMLVARGSVVNAVDNPSRNQDCIAVYYVLVGDLPNKRAFAMGLWSLEVPDHAVGRLLQRDRHADINAVLGEAHRALLRIRSRRVHAHFQNPARRFFLPAGNGVLVCNVYITPHRAENRDDAAISSERFNIYARAWTWLHRDQLSEQQIGAILTDEGRPGERLGDGLLLPEPLRQVQVKSDDATQTIRQLAGQRVNLGVRAWGPGLPETVFGSTPKQEQPKC